MSSADHDAGDEQRPECGNCTKAHRACRQNSRPGLEIRRYRGPGARRHSQRGVLEERGHPAARDSDEDGNDANHGEDQTHREAENSNQTHWPEASPQSPGQTYPWPSAAVPVGDVGHVYNSVSPQASAESHLSPAVAYGASVSINSLLQPESVSPVYSGAGAWIPGQSSSPQAPISGVLSPGEARLVHHYALHLGRWLDCTDASRQFSLKIPALVSSSPILLQAVVSLAARHVGDTAAAASAHEECVRMLIHLLSLDSVAQDDVLLCAIVILRVYEQLSGTSSWHVPCVATLGC